VNHYFRDQEKTMPFIRLNASASRSFRCAWPGAILWLVAVAMLAGCSVNPPPGITPVAPFDAKRYEGKWYEMARLDHRFERGLTDVNATYRAQPDGSIQVINRGFNPEDRAWRQAEGRAYFTGDSRRGSLKVSFFGPFYGGYHVVALDDQDYRWSLVMGPDRDYFWILARDKQIPAALREQLIRRARQFGIDTGKLIWVSQTREDS
jgi:apolipoprotein D and lipocalin family protein